MVRLAVVRLAVVRLAVPCTAAAAKSAALKSEKESWLELECNRQNDSVLELWKPN